MNFGMFNFQQITRRGKKQPVILSVVNSLTLLRAAALIDHVSDNCKDEELAQSLERVRDRLQGIIASDNKRREEIARADPMPFAVAAERMHQQETARLAQSLADRDTLPW
jgi:hypothetical protein